VSPDLADLPVADLRWHVDHLDQLPAPVPVVPDGEGFGH
jgi:hypothetical protein